MSIYAKIAKGGKFRNCSFVNCDGPQIGEAHDCLFEGNLFQNSSFKVANGRYQLRNNVFDNSPQRMGGVFTAINLSGFKFNQGTAVEVVGCGLIVRLGVDALSFLGDIEILEGEIARKK